MMMVEIMREIADGEVIISERIRKKADLEKFLAREDVTAVLEIETEVGQEVFVYAIKMMKVMIGQAIGEMKEDEGVRGHGDYGPLGTISKRDLLATLDAIKPRNPYKGDDQDA